MDLRPWALACHRIGESFEDRRCLLRELIGRLGEGHPLNREWRSSFQEDLEFAQAWVGSLVLPTPNGLIADLRWRLRDESLVVTAGEVLHTLQAITTVLTQELSDLCWFLYLPSNAANLYVAPLAQWETVVAHFPSTEKDAKAATECLALEQFTATVFHLMRVLERGLRALATSLKVPTITQDVSTWGDLLREIKEAAAAHTAVLGKGLAKKAEEEYYAGLMAEFRHFKDAWRDRLSHSSQTYEEDDAERVFRHVQSFMLFLTPRLHE